MSSGHVTVPGRPVGAARPRVTRTGHAYMPDNSVRWEEQARQLAVAAWAGAAPLDEPVRVEVVAWHHRPKSRRRKRDERRAIPACCKPDLDNVVKLALDALVKAGVLVDDTRVVELTARRWYGPIDEAGLDLQPERVEVHWWTLP